MIKASSYINICICLSTFKLLFLKSYVSTDFDVHRNWMAITYNLPVKEWYNDTTSEWTLDYPPMFAWFEYLLAFIAHLLNLHDDLKLTKSSIRTESIITYQRVTVILSDVLYYYAIYRLCESIGHLVSREKNDPKKDEKQGENILVIYQNLVDAIYRPNLTSSIALLLLMQPGLLIVDHIHFQYNGMLAGIFLLSMANVIVGNYTKGAFLYSVLLNYKHIYLYCAPAYGMYFLTSCCLAKVGNQNRVVSFCRRTGQLAAIVTLVFVLSYIPFSEPQILRQIISRLFPFKRGLTHAYWAPNIWSLYNTADKLLAKLFKSSVVAKFDLQSISGLKSPSSTSGLVQEYEHLYLPAVEPVTTFALTGIFTLPLIIKFLSSANKSSPRLFMKGLTIAAFTSFMFGWHVHEKAIILVLLPLVAVGSMEPKLKNVLSRCTLAGTYSLFPLLFQPAEYLTKLTILVAYYCYATSMCNSIKNQEKNRCESKSFLGSLWCKIYSLFDKSFLLALILVESYNLLIHGRLVHDSLSLAKLDFLPLLLTSNISAVGLAFSYLELYYDFVCSGVEELAMVA